VFLLWQIFTISWLFFKKNRQIFQQFNKSTQSFEQVDRISRILLNYYFHSQKWLNFLLDDRQNEHHHKIGKGEKKKKNWWCGLGAGHLRRKFDIRLLYIPPGYI
jgi:hypothetical protein